MEREFRVTIKGESFTAKMQNNKMVEKMAALCPLEQVFEENAGVEYIYRSTLQDEKDDGEIITDLKKGMITYFSEYKSINIMYEDMDIAPYTVIYLGDIEGDVSSLLRKTEKNLTIKFEDVTKNE